MQLTPVRSLFVLAALVIVGVAAAQAPAEKPGTPPPPPERQAAPVENHLKTFDVLDFDVFSNQKWDRLHESHGKDIVVTWPDGHETKGDRSAHRGLEGAVRVGARHQHQNASDSLRLRLVDDRDGRDDGHVH